MPIFRMRRGRNPVILEGLMKNRTVYIYLIFLEHLSFLMPAVTNYHNLHGLQHRFVPSYPGSWSLNSRCRRGRPLPEGSQ